MKNLVKNTRILDNIPAINSPQYQYAYLVLEGAESSPKNRKPTNRENRSQKILYGKSVFEFLYNPETINISLPISWKETAIPFNNISQLTFSNGGNQTLDINEIYLDTYYERKSIQSLLDSLINLRNPIVKEGILLSPPVLYFKWGQYTSFPCVLTNVAYTITHTINGLPCRARLNLSFKEIPSKRNRLQSQTIVKPSSNNRVLTQKQQRDGIKKASQTIRDPKILSRMPKLVQQYIKDKGVSLSIDTHTQQINIVKKDKVLLPLGIYNGDRLILDESLTDKNYKFN